MARISTVTFTLLAAMFFLAVLAYVHLPYRLAGGDTRFSSGYSEFYFQSLLRGTPREVVHEKLGEPLATQRLPRRHIWVYAPLHWASTPIQVYLPRVESRETFVPLRFVYFDENDRVLGAFGSPAPPLKTAAEVMARPYFNRADQPPAGMSKWDVNYRWGIPTFIESYRSQIIDDHALPQESDNYKVRRVYYAEGRVIDAEWYTRFGTNLRHVMPENRRR